MGIPIPTAVSAPPALPAAVPADPPERFDISELLSLSPLASVSDKHWQPQWCKEYSPEILIKCWKLRTTLLSCRTNLTDVLHMALDLAAPPVLRDEIVRKFRRGEWKLPSATKMDSVGRRANICQILYQRELHRYRGFSRQWMAD
eukprot:7869620-Pyramimonas_sp.AAC.1